MASKPHHQLCNVTRENAANHLDFLTKDAVPEGTSDTEWALDNADKVRKAIPDDRLLFPTATSRQRRLVSYGSRFIETVEAWRSGIIQTYVPQERSE